jgi:hypothetical protein
VVTIYEQVAALEPGQHVRVIFEGVVEDQREYPGHNRDELPAISIRPEGQDSTNGMVVLRYYGSEKYPNGLVHPALVDVDVLPIIEEEP